MDEFTCTRCDETKPLDEYYVNDERREKVCKACQRAGIKRRNAERMASLREIRAALRAAARLASEPAPPPPPSLPVVVYDPVKPKRRRATRREPLPGSSPALERIALVSAIKCAIGCADCGLDGPAAILQFDHLPRFKKLFTIAEATGKPADVTDAELLKEILKCDVVCANCHALRTAARALERAIRKSSGSVMT